jgi:hypothetical protein
VAGPLTPSIPTATDVPRTWQGLREAAILTGGRIVAVVEAIGRLTGGGEPFDAHRYVFAVIAIALGVDVSRTLFSLRGAARYKSAALRSNAFHFAGDMAGSVAVLAGQTALDELRKELGRDSVELGELVVLGVGVKLDEIRAGRSRSAPSPPPRSGGG